jgi:hypothetical protein
MVAHVEWSNNLTVMSKLAFVVLGHRQRYNFQEPLASAKVSTRTLPFAGRAVYLRKERVGGSFRSAYLRVTPVLGHWGVYLLGWWTRHAANGHGTRGMQVGADSGRLAGRAITHHRQPPTTGPNVFRPLARITREENHRFDVKSKAVFWLHVEFPRCFRLDVTSPSPLITLLLLLGSFTR